MPTVICGCYYLVDSTERYRRHEKHYLPLVSSSFHSRILSTTSSTVLTQNFTNPSPSEPVKECIYEFPLYDGVSVVKFTCRIGEDVLHGIVKESVDAKAIFDSAVAKGKTAALLEQAPQAADVFSIKLGNIPAGGKVVVETTYIGELKAHESDGVRFTIPTSIAPRYGSRSDPTTFGSVRAHAQHEGGVQIVVDVDMPTGSSIKGLQSPSHPIAVSMGTVSTASEADPAMSKASATLSLGSATLEKDFVLIVQVKDIGTPKAILETHPTIPNHRALMATLVPKFALPTCHPEIVFVADRSGSMQGNIPMLVSAMKVFLKSMPAGVKFNICSFGSSFSFLWPNSQSYTADNLAEAIRHVGTFDSNMGGTQTFEAIEATVTRRWSDLPLEIMLLTDGDIWDQDELFTYINQQVEETKGNIRIFPLGIGGGVSHSLIEGVARAGNGFAQAVQNGERLDSCVVRMLRGALSPHITDYSLEVKYEHEDDEFEVIDKVTDGMKILLSDSEESQAPSKALDGKEPTISLFDSTANLEPDLGASRGPTLPTISPPKLLQAPNKIPSLFPFSRTTVYLLLSPETYQRNPTAIVLRATSAHGPLALEIPIELLPSPQDTIHKLAAKKAVQDLEEGRGWIYDAKDQKGILIKDRYPSRLDELVTKEGVRLGEKFQIPSKWCSFVAVAASGKEISKREAGDKYNDDGYASCIEEEAESDGDLFDLPSEFSRAPHATLSEPSTRAAMTDTRSYTPYASFGVQAAKKMPPMRGGGGFSGRGGSIFASPSSAHARYISPPAAPSPSPPPPAATNSEVDSTGREPLEKLHSIIALQDFDGSWPVDKAEISRILGFDVGENPQGGNKSPWVTVVMVCYLEKKLADEKDTWELVVEKARAWLVDTVTIDLEGLEKEAAKLVDRT
ncbi:uncharacterized protein BP5553_03123 [Venustampulla echinocandica]|uniref:Uncharacterized protein n=1 Tax=Venustampulla echinocandica TaxID=2656787 RepID=A0A370TTE3_9HELO|nr:uncharacterized protein BP5553_03123 [Venustampulla echinocandica]RDL38783.1 hypothetical protein BP5553_03123 [Venustampulla echinocandica]